MLIIDVMIDERISLMLKKIMSLLLAPAFAVLSASAAEAEEDFAEELAAIGIEPGKNVDNETDIIVTPINTETEPVVSMWKSLVIRNTRSILSPEPSRTPAANPHGMSRSVIKHQKNLIFQ